MKKKILFIAVGGFVALSMIAYAVSDKSPEGENAVEDTTVSTAVETDTVEEGYKLFSGEVLSVVDNAADRQIIFKAKIESGLTNKLTIEKNYYNIEYLVKNYDLDAYDELQYWAVADTRDGDETKVISFTVDRKTLDGLKDQTILPNQLGDYVSDLWILPSLTD